MTTTITYESIACSRCDGSGHYSFNQIDGTTCFKCGGSGKVLTSRGIKAREAIHTLRSALTSIPVEEVAVGDWVTHRYESKARKVAAIRDGGTLTSGEVTSSLLVLEDRAGYGVGYKVGDAIERRPTSQEWEELAVLAETLPGATVVRP